MCIRDSVKRVDYAQAIQSSLLFREDFIEFYVNELSQVIDMEAIAKAGVHIGVDPLGGSGIHYWPVIAKKYGLPIISTWIIQQRQTKVHLPEGPLR